ncbi:MAG: flagellar hook-associated protein FlgK [Fuerstiella sp.]
MRSYEIGLSALRAQQTVIATHGHNIANANTPGYARKVVDLAERRPFQSGNLQLGNGVDVVQIRSLRDAAAETALRRNSSLTAAAEAKLGSAQTLETLLTPGDASVHAYLSNFFNDLEAVANAPEEVATRGELIRTAESLLDETRFILNSFDEARQTAAQDLRVGVGQVNTLIDQVARVNRSISESRAAGGEPHTLLANRDALLSQLGEWIDVSVAPLDNGQDLILLGGGAASFGNLPITLESTTLDDGQLAVTDALNRRVIPATSGRLSGLQDVYNSGTADATVELESMLRELVRQVDQLHATGLTSPDGFQSLVATRVPGSADLPLNKAELPFPIEQGSLFISVTDLDTGVRSTHEIEIDPISDSLKDIAAKLDSVPGITSFVIESSNQLVIRSQNNESFDFAGRTDNIPDRTAFTGSAAVEFGGNYTGDQSGRLSLTFTSSGQVGVTSGLIAEVRDENGAYLGTVSAGSDYVPGQPLSVGNGLTVTFGAGDVVSGDTVEIPTIADSDETGILSALGLNSFFSGTETRTFEVRADIKANPLLMAISGSGELGDSTNVAAMADLRDIRFGSLGSRTFVEILADLTADTGLDVQQLQNEVDQLESFGAELQAQRDALTGVDTNEELLRLLAAERAFQAAAKFVTIFDETVVELLGLVR